VLSFCEIFLVAGEKLTTVITIREGKALLKSRNGASAGAIRAGSGSYSHATGTRAGPTQMRHRSLRLPRD